ncbi:DNA-binding response OmpR family regulator [Acidovorax sp. 62]|uniref:response regulator transcription factor n=1 Tax=Acidovorax sp. 62 TaxID=2035203 RepID=UPI000C19B830|nr:response regulator transcription factor [Acidovorax sp. 62]PIF93170.1 DNA-binding response OmpR family regulator [Acidovorax sp. 62]
MRIAALDDDPILLELIKATTEHQGHVCHTYQTGAQLLRDIRHETFDLLIVDWHLPDMEGPEVVASVRQSTGRQLPILFVTRRREEQDVIEALSCGADDFMTKPLRMGELMARATALLRRAYPQAMGNNLAFGPYRFDPDKRSLLLNDVEVDLKNREYELALFMFRNAGRLLSRAHLREVVWGETSEAPSRSLDTHVSRLRSKLDLNPANGYVVSAIYGMGYRLDAVDPHAAHHSPQDAPGSEGAGAAETTGVAATAAGEGSQTGTTTLATN